MPKQRGSLTAIHQYYGFSHLIEPQYVEATLAAVAETRPALWPSLQIKLEAAGGVSTAQPATTIWVPHDVYYALVQLSRDVMARAREEAMR